MVIYVIATLLKPMRGMEAGLAPETTPLVTTCIKQKQIQKILQEGSRGNITAGGHVLNAIFASFYICLG